MHTSLHYCRGTILFALLCQSELRLFYLQVPGFHLKVRVHAHLIRHKPQTLLVFKLLEVLREVILLSSLLPLCFLLLILLNQALTGDVLPEKDFRQVLSLVLPPQSMKLLLLHPFKLTLAEDFIFSFLCLIHFVKISTEADLRSPMRGPPLPFHRLELLFLLFLNIVKVLGLLFLLLEKLVLFGFLLDDPLPPLISRWHQLLL